MNTNTAKTTCHRCKGSGMKGVKHGYAQCLLCHGKGYRTTDEIAGDRAYAADVRDRQVHQRTVEAFARTLPANYERAVMLYTTLLSVAVQARANGVEIEAEAVEIIEQIRDRAGADMFAWIDAR